MKVAAHAAPHAHRLVAGRSPQAQRGQGGEDIRSSMRDISMGMVAEGAIERMPGYEALRGGVITALKGAFIPLKIFDLPGPHSLIFKFLPAPIVGKVFEMLPLSLAAKLASKAGVGASDKIANLIISGLKTAKVIKDGPVEESQQEAVRAFVEAFTKNLSMVYEPEFLKEFEDHHGRNFFTRVIEGEGDYVYGEMADALMKKTFNEVGGIVTDSLLGKVSEVETAATDTLKSAQDRVIAVKEHASESVKHVAANVTASATHVRDSASKTIARATNVAKEAANEAQKSIQKHISSPSKKNFIMNVFEKLQSLIKGFLPQGAAPSIPLAKVA